MPVDKIDKILVPVHDNGCDDEALRLAGEIARANKATIHALYVIEVKRDLPLDAEITQETSKGEKVLHHRSLSLSHKLGGRSHVISPSRSSRT